MAMDAPATGSRGCCSSSGRHRRRARRRLGLIPAAIRRHLDAMSRRGTTGRPRCAGRGPRGRGRPARAIRAHRRRAAAPARRLRRPRGRARSASSPSTAGSRRSRISPPAGSPSSASAYAPRIDVRRRADRPAGARRGAHADGYAADVPRRWPPGRSSASTTARSRTSPPSSRSCARPRPRRSPSCSAPTSSGSPPSPTATASAPRTSPHLPATPAVRTPQPRGRLVMTASSTRPELEGLGRYDFGWADSDVAGADARRGLSEDVVATSRALQERAGVDARPPAQGPAAVRARSRCRPGAPTCPASTSTTSSTSCARPRSRPPPGTTCPPTSRTPTTGSASPRPRSSAWSSGVAAQYESEVVYHQIREDLEQQGVIFLDTDTGAARARRSCSASTSAR